MERVRMESREYYSELMKQAEKCGRVYQVTQNSTWLVVKFQCQLVASDFGSTRSQPTLNQTGGLKATFWRRSRWTNSSWKGAAASEERKYPAFMPQPRRVSARRPTSCLTQVSRSPWHTGA